MKSLVEDPTSPFFFLTLRRHFHMHLSSSLHFSVTKHGGSYSSYLLNLIPDQPRWWMELAVISDWLFCFFTSLPAYIYIYIYIYICSFFKLYLVFISYLTFCFQNCCYCESSQSEPSQTERYLLRSDPICLGSIFRILPRSLFPGHWSLFFQDFPPQLCVHLAVSPIMSALSISETVEPPVHSKCLFRFHWEITYSVFFFGMGLWITIANDFIPVCITIS